MSNKPKPCPFCGEKPWVTHVLHDDKEPMRKHLWKVECFGCQIVGPLATDKYDAIHAWDRGVSNPKLWQWDDPRQRTIRLSDTERQEAGYPASREELVEVLRLVNDMVANDYNVTDRHIVIVRIHDILKREG